MTPAVDEHQTCCPRCTAPYVYTLGVNDGGGFRYDVSCPPCGDIYFEMSAPPLVYLPVAA